jgi:hypothetical protein
MKVTATKVIPATTEEVSITLTAEEAAHLAHRLNVSSFVSFDDYRKKNKLSNFHRHPFADNIIAGLAEAGVTI